MFQSPPMVFSLLLASAYAAAFQLWQGRNLGDLLAFWLAAVLGFATGQLSGLIYGVVPWTIGQVHIVEATLGAGLALAIAKWLRHGAKTS